MFFFQKEKTSDGPRTPILDPNNIPKHVAIIMDGNGRWAKNRHMPRSFGHKRGADRVHEIVELANNLGITALTLFAFSEENWNRPKSEIDVLMRLLNSYLVKETENFKRNNIRLNVIGDVSRLPEANQKCLNETCDILASNTGLILTLALSYSGKSELLRATKSIAQAISSGFLTLPEINIETFNQHLETKNLPDLDLLIRTSGEKRISNFMLWQVAYTELYFTDIMWPDFNESAFIDALAEFQKRHRRFGRISEHSSDIAMS